VPSIRHAIDDAINFAVRAAQLSERLCNAGRLGDPVRSGRALDTSFPPASLADLADLADLDDEPRGRNGSFGPYVR
jgi:hypothetical protein